MQVVQQFDQFERSLAGLFKHADDQKKIQDLTAKAMTQFKEFARHNNETLAAVGVLHETTKWIWSLDADVPIDDDFLDLLHYHL